MVVVGVVDQGDHRYQNCFVALAQEEIILSPT